MAILTADGAPKMALIDFGSTFTGHSYWDGNWKNPRLDSPLGVHNAGGKRFETHWWKVDMPGDDMYEVSSMTLQKRGDGYDGCCTNRTILAVTLTTVKIMVLPGNHMLVVKSSKLEPLPKITKILKEHSRLIHQ